jgi:hypothetical protein
MNKWEFTAIIKGPVRHDQETGLLRLNWTAINTEKIYDENNQLIDVIETTIDCVWKNPPGASMGDIHYFKDKALIKIKGRPYLRKYTRNDGTQGFSVACFVYEGWFRDQYGKGKDRAGNDGEGASDGQS